MRYLLGLMLVVVYPHLAVAQKQGKLLVDSLLKVLPIAKEDTHKVLLLDKLSYTYSTTNPKEGLKAGREALLLSEKLKWPKGIAGGYTDIGINYGALSRPDSALHYYLKALSQYRLLKNKKAQSAILSNICLVHLAKSNYPKALEYAFAALKINEETGDRISRGIMLENIGTIYSRQQQYRKAIEYFAEATKLYTELGDKNGMARSHANMGIVYDANGEHDKALQNHLESLKINTAAGNEHGMQINLANIGYVYNHKQDYTNALQYQFRALEISRQLEMPDDLAVNLGNIGETYYAIASDAKMQRGGFIKNSKKENLKTAIKYLDSAVSICAKINFAGPQTEYCQYLSDAYLSDGNYKKAYEYQKISARLKDSIFSIEHTVRLADLETKRELSVKEKELLIKDRELLIQNLQLEKKRNERILFISCMVLLLITILLVLRELYIYRRRNRILVREKERHLEMIEEQMDRIKLQTDVLKEISHMQAHDVRGPVASILGLVQLFNLKDYADPINKIIIEGVSDATEKLDSAVQDVIKRENENR
jgi:tetratricopeptide (TPR) repeat protein